MIQNRSVRVQLLPIVGTTMVQPGPWPKSKEIFIHVNDQETTNVYKRQWPGRAEIAKTYLPLDITQHISLNGGNGRNQLMAVTPHQRIQVDCLSPEYQSSCAVVLMSVLTESEVLRVHRPLLRRSLDDLQPLYVSVMKGRLQDGEEEDEDVQCDVPTVTLKCSISQMRIQVPVRGSRCSHLQCVDFASYIRCAHNACYSNCIICDAPMRLGDIIVDEAMFALLSDPSTASWTHAQLQWSSTGQVIWGPSDKSRRDAVDLDDEENHFEQNEHRLPSNDATSNLHSGVGVRSELDDHVAAAALLGEAPDIGLIVDTFVRAEQLHRKRSREADCDGSSMNGGLHFNGMGSADEPICLD